MCMLVCLCMGLCAYEGVGVGVGGGVFWGVFILSLYYLFFPKNVQLYPKWSISGEKNVVSILNFSTFS